MHIMAPARTLARAFFTHRCIGTYVHNMAPVCALPCTLLRWNVHCRALCCADMYTAVNFVTVACTLPCLLLRQHVHCHTNCDVVVTEKSFHGQLQCEPFFDVVPLFFTIVALEVCP